MSTPACAQRLLGALPGAISLLLSSLFWGSSPAMGIENTFPPQAQTSESLDLIQDRPSYLQSAWATSITTLGWLWESFYDNTIHWLTPPSPTTLTNRVSKRDAVQLFRLLGEAGYTLTEIDSQVGIIPTIAFKFGQVRELSEADYEYLESVVTEWHEHTPGLYSNLQRSILDTVIAVNLSTDYHVSSLEIQLLPLPEVAFSVSPKVTALSEENSALMIAIHRVDRSTRGQAGQQQSKTSFVLAPNTSASPAAPKIPVTLERSPSAEQRAPKAELPATVPPKPTPSVSQPSSIAVTVPQPT